MSTTVKQFNVKYLIGWLVNIIIPLMVLFIPTNELFSDKIKMYLVVTLFFIIALIFNNLCTTLIGILMPVCYVVLGVSGANVAFSSYSNHVIWLVLGSFVLSDMMTKVGVAKRLVYKCMVLTGGSYRGMLFGVMLVAIVLTLVVPGKVHFLLAPLCYSLIQTLNYGESKESAGIMMTSAFACSTGGLFLYGTNIVMMEQIGKSVYDHPLSWTGYITNNLPVIFFMLAMVFIFSIMFKPNEQKHDVISSK